MPELAEVDYYRKRWNPGLGHRIEKVLVHPKARVFRGTNTSQLVETLTGATLEKSESLGKQMLFVAKKRTEKAWIGVHLGMTGELRIEPADYAPARHDHLVLQQARHSLVFEDPRLFGRILFDAGKEEPKWWSKLPPDLLSEKFTKDAMADFLKRRGRAPMKAVLLMQERFPRHRQLDGR